MVSPFLLCNDYLYYRKMLLYYTKNKWVKANCGKCTLGAINRARIKYRAAAERMNNKDWEKLF
jgi:hypothetical protein